jgi:hypothetical protein
MAPITVTHSLGSYQVHVEPGLLLSLHSLLVEPLAGRRLAMITDDTVATSGPAPARRIASWVPGPVMPASGSSPSSA